MLRSRRIPALPLRSRATWLPFLFAALLAGGCSVHRTVVQEGRAFPVERIPAADAGWRAGLHRDAVRSLFGPPYATGIDGDGRPYWEYSHRGQSTTSGGGGLLLVGVVATQAATGAQIRFVFGPDAHVLQVVWEIAGPDAYRMLGGEGAR